MSRRTAHRLIALAACTLAVGTNPLIGGTSPAQATDISVPQFIIDLWNERFGGNPSITGGLTCKTSAECLEGFVCMNGKCARNTTLPPALPETTPSVTEKEDRVDACPNLEPYCNINCVVADIGRGPDEGGGKTYCVRSCVKNSVTDRCRVIGKRCTHISECIPDIGETEPATAYHLPGGADCRWNDQCLSGSCKIWKYLPIEGAEARCTCSDDSHCGGNGMVCRQSTCVQGENSVSSATRLSSTGQSSLGGSSSAGTSKKSSGSTENCTTATCDYTYCVYKNRSMSVYSHDTCTLDSDCKTPPPMIVTPMCERTDDEINGCTTVTCDYQRCVYKSKKGWYYAETCGVVSDCTSLPGNFPPFCEHSDTPDRPGESSASAASSAAIRSSAPRISSNGSGVSPSSKPGIPERSSTMSDPQRSSRGTGISSDPWRQSSSDAFVSSAHNRSSASYRLSCSGIDTGCPEGYFCYSNDRCMPKGNEGARCFEDYQCLNGQCENYHCEAQAASSVATGCSGGTTGCAAGQFCTLNRCYPILQDGAACNAGYWCQSGICLSGRCGNPPTQPRPPVPPPAGCNDTDRQCLYHQYCTLNGICADKKKGGEACTANKECLSSCKQILNRNERRCDCYQNADCPDGQICMDTPFIDGGDFARRVCRTSECATDADCNGLLCIRHFCEICNTTDRVGNGGCGVGKYCDSVSQRCEIKKGASQPCADNNACETGICQWVFGSEMLPHSSYPVNKACSCGEATPCRSGYRCSYGRCEADPPDVPGGASGIWPIDPSEPEIPGDINCNPWDIQCLLNGPGLPDSYVFPKEYPFGGSLLPSDADDPLPPDAFWQILWGWIMD